MAIASAALQSILSRALSSRIQWGINDASGAALADPRYLSGSIKSSSFSAFTDSVGTAAFWKGVGGIAAAAGGWSEISTGSVGYEKSARAAEFPVERGGFASYNKAEMPGIATVMLRFSGYLEIERTAFLAKIDAACRSTALVSVVTPTVTYADHTIESYRYRREAEGGVTLLAVEMRLKEIRQVSAQYSKSTGTLPAAATPDAPKDAGSVAQVDTGKVQAQDLSNVSPMKAIYDSAGPLVKKWLNGAGIL